VWPVGFEDIKSKLKEYGKKKKEDAGLAFVEYGSGLESEDEPALEPELVSKVLDHP
jgi:hypothetical protein